MRKGLLSIPHTKSGAVTHWPSIGVRYHATIDRAQWQTIVGRGPWKTLPPGDDFIPMTNADGEYVGGVGD